MYFFYNNPTPGYQEMEGGDQIISQAPAIVNLVCENWLGVVGSILAILGVIAAPITSGDTARRSARLIIADFVHLEQKSIRNRLLLTIPLLAVGGLLTWFAIVNDNGFQTIWRYFSWSNQTLAMIALWVSTAYLLKKGKYRFGSLLTAFPAAFMTAVSLTYILMAKEGLQLDQTVSYAVGAAAAAILFAVYAAILLRRKQRSPSRANRSD
jgi:carbon starvation protein CstA